MRPVNLLPDELRARAAGEGDPRMAYSIVAGLAVLLAMVVLAILQSNKATTLQDQAEAIRAEANQVRSRTRPAQSFNDFADVVNKRTLLVGGLAKSRFPWDTVLHDLSRSMPEDVTLDSIDAQTVGSVEGEENTEAATMELEGCTASWVGLSRFLVRARNLPGVRDVTVSDGNGDSESDDGSSADDASGSKKIDDSERKKNCGAGPVQFSIKVIYSQRVLDLVDLPKAGGAPAASADGAPAPAASTTPTPATGG